jgi:hypothetical protein
MKGLPKPAGAIASMAFNAVTVGGKRKKGVQKEFDKADMVRDVRLCCPVLEVLSYLR